jgi:hypothetical protein
MFVILRAGLNFAVPPPRSWNGALLKSYGVSLREQPDIFVVLSLENLAIRQ